jgi:glycosyltransferase involved in cell wall biosynthesis
MTTDGTSRVGAMEAGLAAATARIEALEQAQSDQQRHLQVRTVMDWIKQAELNSDPLVSVILPTRDRAELLPRAVSSVLHQSYSHWELLIVDDASRDATPDVIANIDDHRVRHFVGRGVGVAAARNIALDEANGQMIAFLDDDNTMHPDWLRSVVWAFEQHPTIDVLYGAYVVDDPLRTGGRSSGGLPSLLFYAYDHHAVVKRNIADIGCIAHRAGLPEGRFDETLRNVTDWDLFLRLTREGPPLQLPAVACFYRSDSPHRLSWGPTFEADVAAVRRRNAR